MPTDKIKRAITWIRKSLEITEKTTQPATVDGTILPVMDVLGWERLNETQQFIRTAVATTIVTGDPAPEGVLRLVVECSVNHSDPIAANVHWLWIRHDITAAVTPGVSAPLEVPGGPQVAMPRWIVLRPGEKLDGRAFPATGIGINLTIMMSFIDLPIGEYVKAL